MSAIHWPTRRALALVCTLVAISAAVSGTPAKATVFRVSVGPAEGHSLAGDFLGLALEYRSMPGFTGAGPRSVNPVLVQLIRNLAPTGRPVLRIGGQSTDRTWWPVRGLRRPLGITYELTPRWMASVHALAQATDARMILSVGLEAGRPRIASTEAAQLLRGVGRRYVEALEIGNEPELYSIVQWYRVLRGAPIPWYSHVGSLVFARPPGYGPGDFVNEFARTLRVLPPVPIAGPDVGLPPWLNGFRPLVTRRSRVRIVTWHAYGLSQCITVPFSPLYPSVPNLLALPASRNMLGGIGPDVALAHAAGDSFRLDEMNSVTCNGRLGVSNTFASALWVMDALFAIAAGGADGVNIHTYQDAANGLFDFGHAHGRWNGSVHPLYYGALMFAQAAPAGSRLLRISAGSQSQVRAWATLGPDHRIRVLLINDSLGLPARALVHVPGRAATASIERLRAASAYATNGVTLGGRSFATATETGLLPAARLKPVVSRGGAYALALPAASAALLTIPPGRLGHG